MSRYSEEGKLTFLSPVPKREVRKYSHLRRAKSPFRPMTASKGFRLKQLLSPVKQKS